MKGKLLTNLHNHLKQLGIDPIKLTGLQSLTDKTLKAILAIQNKKKVEKILSVYQNLYHNFDDELVGFFEDLPFDENWTDFANAILKATGYKQAYYAIKVAQNKDVLSSGHAVELVQIIATAKGDFQASDAAYLITAHYEVLLSEHVVEIVRIVTNAETICQSYYASRIARNPKVLANEHAVELVQIVANAKGDSQAHFASIVAQNENVLASGYVVELVRAVANAKGEGEPQPKYTCEVALNEDVLASGIAVELVQIVANAEGEEQARYASVVAQNKDVLASGHAVEVVKAIANEPDESKVKYLYEQIINNNEMKLEIESDTKILVKRRNEKCKKEKNNK